MKRSKGTSEMNNHCGVKQYEIAKPRLSSALTKLSLVGCIITVKEINKTSRGRAVPSSIRNKLTVYKLFAAVKLIAY